MRNFPTDESTVGQSLALCGSRGSPWPHAFGQRNAAASPVNLPCVDCIVELCPRLYAYSNIELKQHMLSVLRGAQHMLFSYAQ